MSRPVKVTLMGKPFTLQTDEPEEHVQRVASLVDDRLMDLQRRVNAPPQSVALLAALTLGDELEKERARNAELLADLRARTRKLRARIARAAGETA